jgi:hypothetical protein
MVYADPGAPPQPVRMLHVANVVLVGATATLPAFTEKRTRPLLALPAEP